MKLDSSYLWSPRYATGIIITLLVSFGLIILMEIVTVFTFRHNINTTLAAAGTSPQPVIKKEKIAKSFDTELFGVYIPPSVESKDIKQSALNLMIVGIMHATDPDDSLVIIKSSSGTEEGYRIGDVIEDDVTLESIHPEWVIVKHNDALERLNLPAEELIFEPVPEPLTED